eukprot:gnl/Trimastix_PCT/1181.p1 GENE.gnl/Trimastix_PCT/1181~~gnl/Trimastix_PCT/1181.p1  ORF type:complete len:360 (+),score=87.95 gnl/Trimastix_PCT/1181:267-1346(+)
MVRPGHFKWLKSATISTTGNQARDIYHAGGYMVFVVDNVARIFEYRSPQTWAFVQEFHVSKKTNVAMTGDLLVIPTEGAICSFDVHVRQTTGSPLFKKIHTITQDGCTQSDRYYTAAYGTTVLVTSKGRIHVETLRPDGSWIIEADSVPSPATGPLSITMHDDRFAIVGQQETKPLVRVHERVRDAHGTPSWVHTETLQFRGNGLNWPNQIEMSTDTLVFCSMRCDMYEAAYVNDKHVRKWIHVNHIDLRPEPVAGWRSGYSSVALRENTLVVGSPSGSPLNMGGVLYTFLRSRAPNSVGLVVALVLLWIITLVAAATVTFVLHRRFMLVRRINETPSLAVRRATLDEVAKEREEDRLL